jgi:hypothetical protein
LGDERGVALADLILDRGGRILANVSVQLIFWGQAWVDDTTHSATQVTRNVSKLLSSAYMLGLSQYRGIEPGTLLRSYIATGFEAPQHFRATDVEHLVSSVIAQRAVPDFRDPRYTDILYFVCMSAGHGFNGLGFHGAASIDRATYHYACVNFGDETTLTYGISHELVEACTDAEPRTGFVSASGAVGGSSSDVEIADWCSTGDFTDGVYATGYWSNVDGRCIVPKRVARIEVEGSPGCLMPPVQGHQSILRARVVGDPPWIDVSHLPALVAPFYQWSVTGVSTLTPLDQPSISVEWPSHAGTVSVSVTIQDATGITVSGTRTLTPLDEVTAGRIRFWCDIRSLLYESIVLNPICDPRRDFAAVPPSTADLEVLRSVAAQLLALIGSVEKADSLPAAEE